MNRSIFVSFCGMAALAVTSLAASVECEAQASPQVASQARRPGPALARTQAQAQPQPQPQAQAQAQARSHDRAQVSSVPLIRQAESLILAHDYLGFRVFLKKAYQRTLTFREWDEIKTIVNANAGKIGFDTVYLWNARNITAKSNLDKTLEHADSLMLAGSFNPAFTEYQRMAAFLKRMRAYLEISNRPGDTRLKSLRKFPGPSLPLPNTRSARFPVFSPERRP